MTHRYATRTTLVVESLAVWSIQRNATEQYRAEVGVPIDLSICNNRKRVLTTMWTNDALTRSTKCPAQDEVVLSC
jgi:hypothetical protein